MLSREAGQLQAHTVVDNAQCLLHSPYISRHGLSFPRAHASTGTLEAWYTVLVQKEPQGVRERTSDQS